MKPLPRSRGFALVLTLLILSVLAIVAVSYLVSMSAERGTANAFANRTRAEQAAQAGAEAAMAILRESFRAYPDSATVWDTAQSRNSDADDSFNAGTSLYLRAQPITAPVPDITFVAPPNDPNATVPTVNVTVPNPAPAAPPDNRPPMPTASGAPATDTRRTFVLPLVSGVGNGQPRLVSEGRPAASKGAANGGTLPEFNAAEADQSKPDTFDAHTTDLNVRRFSNDRQGVIGSPPGWGEETISPHTAPKPARARWVEFKDKDGADAIILSRYAFFVEDESFKANVNLATDVPTKTRADNTNDFDAPGARRPFAPKDLSLPGLLTALDVPLAATDPSNAIPNGEGKKILDLRGIYPASFFPEPRAFQRADLHTPQSATYPDIYGDNTLTTDDIKKSRALDRYRDHLAYETSTTSGALNLTRHGSQRVNLNALVKAGPGDTVGIQREVNQLVNTLKFHLPFWGQRFYRLTAATDSATLNRANEVAGNAAGGHAQIYFYKTVANLRDYVDADPQPTIILTGGVVAQPKPLDLVPGNDGLGGDGPNSIWAQGKESAPFLQEAAVRYRPVVTGTTYDLQIDYYLEFWNLTNHDITARQLGSPFVHIAAQQGWSGTSSNPAKPTPQPVETPARDFNLDLLQGVSAAGTAPNPASPVFLPDGVVFKAGVATVVTTDPDFQTLGSSYTSYSTAANPLPLTGASIDTSNVYHCSNNFVGVPRHYTGLAASSGIRPNFRDSTTEDYEVEILLNNSNGLLDCALGAVAMGGGSKATTNSSGPYLRDYTYGGTLKGNGGSKPALSETGDPRSNNEQIAVRHFISGGTSNEPDQSRYFNPGNIAIPFSLGRPNNYFTKPAETSGGITPWPDYYDFPSTVYPSPNPDAKTAPAVVDDTLLTSIGQLGDIYDPARLKSTFGTQGVEGARGGGRTFKIGQRDDRYTPDPAGNAVPDNTVDNLPASNAWAAWRLADVFSVDDPIRLPARLNLNGVARDNGTALLAALNGFIFQPSTGTDPLVHGDDHDTNKTKNLAGKTLNPSNTAANGVGALVTALTARITPPPTTSGGPAPTALTLPRPLFERGELGELGTGTKALFGVTGGSAFLNNSDLVPGVDMNKTFDRGREELFRRIVEMTCTRGDTFTIHCVGQSISQPTAKAPKRVISTQRLRVTFRLVPKNPNGTDFHPGYTLVGGVPQPVNFDPADATDATGKRFATPDHYDVQILQSSNAAM